MPDEDRGREASMVPGAVGDMTLEGNTRPRASGNEEASRAWFVTFRLDKQAYALPLDIVERALRMVAVVLVPEGPAWVIGGINLHGQVVPVIDLRRRFGRAAREPALHDRLLVIRPLGQSMALMVDEVGEVLEVPRLQVESPPDPLSRSRVLTAVIRHQGELILVLDPDKLLPPVSEFKPIRSGMPGVSDNRHPNETDADR